MKLVGLQTAAKDQIISSYLASGGIAWFDSLSMQTFCEESQSNASVEFQVIKDKPSGHQVI